MWLSYRTFACVFLMRVECPCLKKKRIVYEYGFDCCWLWTFRLFLICFLAITVKDIPASPPLLMHLKVILTWVYKGSMHIGLKIH